MDTPQNVSRADTLVTLVTADRRLPSLVAVYLAAAPSTRASESSVMPATDLLAQDTSFPAGWGGREREGEGGREREGGRGRSRKKAVSCRDQEGLCASPQTTTGTCISLSVAPPLM